MEPRRIELLFLVCQTNVLPLDDDPVFAKPLWHSTFLIDSGTEGIRTLYLIVANDALSQVSYSPVTRYFHTQANALEFPLHATTLDNEDRVSLEGVHSEALD